MEPTEYAVLHQYETRYWWYRAQRAVLLVAVRSLDLPPGARTLDVGCGTGRNQQILTEALGVRGFGIDFSPHAARWWPGNGSLRQCLGSANDIPCGDGSFDAVITVDVVYSWEVDPPRAAIEMARVLKPGGRLVIIVPAYRWMRSSHDQAVHGVHRFTRARLRRLLESAGLAVDRLTHFSTALFPVIAAVRLMRKCRHGNGTMKRSDLRPMPRWLDRSLLAVAMTERHVVRHLDLPFGSSILGIARKSL